MLGWLMLGAAAVFMYHVAEAENRRPVLWAGITFLACFGAMWLIPFPLLNIVIGLAAAYAAMFVLKVIDEYR